MLREKVIFGRQRFLFRPTEEDQKETDEKDKNQAGCSMVLLYLPRRNEDSYRLEKVITRILPNEPMEVCGDLVSLSRKLRDPQIAPRIVVLLALTKGDLSGLLSVRDLLEGPRLILVVPNSDSDTIGKAHTLRPRFLTYSDGDFIELAAVLGKMGGTLSSKRKRPKGCQ